MESIFADPSLIESETSCPAPPVTVKTTKGEPSLTVTFGAVRVSSAPWIVIDRVADDVPNAASAT